MRKMMMVGLAAVLVGGFGLTGVLAQAPAVKRDFDKEAEAALRAAKQAAGFEWLGTLNRLCVLPPTNGAPSTADNVPNYVSDPKTAPARAFFYSSGRSSNASRSSTGPEMGLPSASTPDESIGSRASRSTVRQRPTASKFSSAKPTGSMLR